MEVLQKIKEELKSFEEKKKALVAELQKDFPSIFKPIFDKSKLINSIGWTQYTPYFNDGEECIFSVNNGDLYINGYDEYDTKWYSWSWGKEDAPDGVNKEECAIINEFKEVLQSIPDEFYKDLFGDHAKVTINRGGTIETDEYEHD